jgi:hypothetical protein
MLILVSWLTSYNPWAHLKKKLFVLCRGEMSMEDMDILGANFEGLGGVRLQPGALNR